MPKLTKLSGKEKDVKDAMNAYTSLQNVFNTMKVNQNSRHGWNKLIIDMQNCTLKFLNDRMFQVTYHRIETGLPYVMTKKLEEGYKNVDEIVKEFKKELKEAKLKVSFDEVKEKKNHCIEKYSRIMNPVSHVFGGMKQSAVARYYLRNTKVYKLDE